MQDSKMNTVTVPVIGTNPATLFYAGKRPMRVAVRNVGGAQIFLAHDSPTLNNAAVNAATYRLPIGETEVFVLAPKQGLFAAASGAGGQISIAVSEAIPMTLES